MKIRRACIALSLILTLAVGIRIVAQTQPAAKSLAGALIKAAGDNDVRASLALLIAGADVDARGSDNNTALIVALRADSVDAALLLVRHGADVNVADEYRATALGLAFQLPVSTSGGNAKTEQTNKQSTESDILIQEMLDKGANVNAALGNGAPLILAMARDLSEQSASKPRWTKLLLDKGASVNATTWNYAPALFSTVNAQRHADFPYKTARAIQSLLLDHGADVNATDQGKQTILLSALHANDFPFAKLLIERGAKLDCTDNAHKTPLLWAAYYGQLDLIKLMMARHADVNVTDDLGQGAVQLAQKGGHADAVALLRKAGAVSQPIPAATKNHLGQIVTHLRITGSRITDHQEAISFAVGEIKNVPILGTKPMLLIKQGNQIVADPVTFGALWTDRTLWDHSQLNEHLVQEYNTDTYRIFGLVTIKNRVYLGLHWWTMGASDNHQILHLVFEIAVRNDALELTLLRQRVPDYNGEPPFLTRGSKIPSLSKSRKGSLILTDDQGVWKYLPTGTWKKIGSAPKNTD